MSLVAALPNPAVTDHLRSDTAYFFPGFSMTDKPQAVILGMDTAKYFTMMARLMCKDAPPVEKKPGLDALIDVMNVLRWYGERGDLRRSIPPRDRHAPSSPRHQAASGCRGAGRATGPWPVASRRRGPWGPCPRWHDSGHCLR